MKKKKLEMFLQTVPHHPNPRALLEQYLTPAPVAADILYTAHGFGDIEDKQVLDLGCGTGIFSIGAKLLGARRVVGIDIDPEAIEVARRFATKHDIEIEFSVTDVATFRSDERYDTVFQNPPFGAQKPLRGTDRTFLKKALEVADVIYTLHLSRTLSFVRMLIKKLNGTVTLEKNYKFALHHIFPFHKRERLWIDVTLIRVIKI